MSNVSSAVSSPRDTPPPPHVVQYLKVPPKLWVRVIGTSGQPIKVSTNQCEDVANFIKAIRKEVSPDLDGVSLHRLSLHRGLQDEALEPDLALEDLVVQRNILPSKPKNPLFIKVTHLPLLAGRTHSQTATNKLVTDLTEKILLHTPLAAPATTTVRNPDFKEDLIAYYECEGPEKSGLIRCMILDEYLPSAVVIASHLFRRSSEFISKDLLNLDNIDDVRNGLFMFKPIEHAYDHFHLSFLYDLSSQEYFVKLWNPHLRRLPLIHLFEYLKSENGAQGRSHALHHDLPLGHLPKGWEFSRSDVFAPGTRFNVLTTFGDIEGRPIAFRSLNRPFSKCLNVQARLARIVAVKENWLTSETQDDFEDFWTDFDRQKEVEAWLKAVHI